MKQMTVGRKISLTAGVLVAFTVLLAAASLLSIGSLSERIWGLEMGAIPGQHHSGRINALAFNLQVKMNAELLDLVANAGKQAQQKQADVAATQAKLREELKAYEKTLTRSEDRELFGLVGPALERCMQSFEQLRGKSRIARSDEVFALYRSETVPAMEALGKATEQSLEAEHGEARQLADEAASAAATAKWWNWGVALLSVLTGLLLSVFVVRGVNRAMRQAVQELAEGADQVASAASQVASSSQSLAQGSSEQAASLEETSASTEEINSMARQNGDNSRSAAGLMTQSEQKFIEANRSLDQSVVAMSEINTQSGKISKIIKTIDEIAFQTNILALNAAVEAARAGEAGMGFAVVADEVRNLAQRCAQAAKDTAALIEESIAKSNDGKVKVDQVVTAIRAITEEAAKAKTLVDEVNQGSQEQVRGIEQIGKAILQMEQVTQKTAANAEESASAAEELNAQSEALNEIVERLTALVGGGHSSHTDARCAHRRAAAAQASRYADETGASLTALRKAIPRQPHPSELDEAGRRAFPLDEQFKEF